jgi:hypothetical protein
MPLKIHADNQQQSSKPQRIIRKKPKEQAKPPEVKVKPYLLVVCTLGKSPRIEQHLDLKSLTAAVRAELRVSLPEDVRVFVMRGKQLPVQVTDDNLIWQDGEQSAVLRLPLPAAEPEAIRVTGELFASDDLSPPDPTPSAAGLDDDFLFA